MSRTTPDGPVLDPDATPPRHDARAAGGARLLRHGALLLLVLVALMPVVGTHTVWSADEGAALAQADLLADGRGWVMDNPFPEADPGGTAFPLGPSYPTGSGTAPFLGHPAYALLAGLALRLGGPTGAVGLSILGTVLAALAAAKLARRLDPALEVPVLWSVGLASPLVFDSFLVMAHSLGAAAAGGLAVAVLAGLHPGRRPLVVWLAAAASLSAAGVLVRNESMLLALAVAAALVATGVGAAQRGGRGDAARALALAAATTGGAAAVYVAQPVWVRHIVGPSPAGTFSIVYDDPFVTGRLRALGITWFSPGYGDLGLPAVLVLIALMLSVAAAVILRRAGDLRGALVLGGAAAAVLAVRLPLRSGAVPGLWAACPLVAAGVLLARNPWAASASSGDGRSDASTERLLAGAAGLFGLAVLGTQYSRGGGGEWGGRYFAVGLPLVAPLAAFWLLTAYRTAASATTTDQRAALRRPAIAVLVLLGLIPSMTAVAAVRGGHRAFEAVLADVRSHWVAPGDGGLPVVIAIDDAVGRAGWDLLDDTRWLNATIDQLVPVAERLQGLGIESFTFVTRDPVAHFQVLDPLYTSRPSTTVSDWTISVVDTRLRDIGSSPP